MKFNQLETWQQIFIVALFQSVGKIWNRPEENLENIRSEIPSASSLDDLFSAPLILLQDAKNIPSPFSAMAYIVNEAGYLSFGGAHNYSQNSFSSLKCIFDCVAITPKDPAGELSKQHYLQHICRMLPTKDGYIFPTTQEDQGLPLKLKNQWKAFFNELSKEVKENELADLTSLYAICKKHLWCIPVSLKLEHQDISMFEQARLAAAIAVCMYHRLRQETPALEPEQWPSTLIENRTEERYLLVSADFSGIQSFIYNIAHSGALKALKGRSFLLQQILDHAALDLIQLLDLTDANLLYSSGGKFYALLPNTPKAVEAVRQVEQSVNKALLQLYGCESALLTAILPLKGSDFITNEVKKTSNLPKIWDDLNRILATKSKFRKFDGLLDEDFFIVSDDLRPFGSVEVCYATGIELCTKDSLTSMQRVIEDDKFWKFRLKEKNIYQLKKGEQPANSESPYLSEEQFQAQKIGQKLKDGKIIGTHYSNSGEFGTFGEFSISITENKSIQARRNTLLNSDDILEELGNLPSKSFKFYGGNWQLDDELLEREDGSRIEGSFEYWKNNAKGIPYLSVLRMDVDNLGKIFKDGLGKEATISRIVQLSSMLDFFFCGYLNRLKDLYWDAKEGVIEVPTEVKLENAIQIVYSGGDDLFIVGRWDVMPDVAIWIHKKFKEFTGYHPDLSISAGIALFNAQQPLFKVAEIAGEAEEWAKKYTRGKKQKSKDAVCFLGNPMSWEDFQEVSRLAKIWYGYVNEGYNSHKLPKAFLGIIQNLFTEFISTVSSSSGVGTKWKIAFPDEESLKPGRYGPWRWRAAYSIKRMADRHKIFEQELNQLANDLFLSNKSEKDYLFLMNTAAQWADFLTREK